MSIQQLRTPAMAGHVAAAARAVAAAGRVPAGSLERGELGGLMSDLAALEAQVTALKLAVLVEADHCRASARAAIARSPGARCTIPTPGPRAGAPTSTTRSRSAASTTAARTTARST